MINKPGPKIDQAAIVALEKELGCTLPTSLRDFLLAHNGGRPVPRQFLVPGHPEGKMGVKLLYGVTRPSDIQNMGFQFREFRECYGEGKVAIAGTDTGDRILLDVSDGSIWFWDYTANEEEGDRALYRIADSHPEFLNSLTA
jgi:hypothetical protein